MSELSKTQPQSLGLSLQSSVLASVDKPTRIMAAEAVDWFSDRPFKDSIDLERTVVKLAAHLHRIEATPDEIVAACIDLDTRITFRPLVPDYLEAIERVRSAKRAAEVARCTVEVIDPNGVAFMMSPENAAEWVQRGWTYPERPVYADARERLKAVDKLGITTQKEHGSNHAS